MCLHEWLLMLTLCSEEDYDVLGLSRRYPEIGTKLHY